MTTILESVRDTIESIDNTAILVSLACIPIVGSIVQVVKERALFSAIKHERNQSRSLALLQEKNRITKISSVGLAVQGLAIFAIAIFAGAGFYALAALVPFGVLIAYNVSKIKYNDRSIEQLQAGGIFVPNVR